MLNNKELECIRPLASSLPACSTERSASTKRKETNMLKKIKKSNTRFSRMTGNE